MDWSLITHGGGDTKWEEGGKSKCTPTKKGRGAKNVLAMLKERGAQQVLR